MSELKKFNSLLKWLKNNGSIFPDLKLNNGDERGVISKEQIEKGIPIKIYKSCIITEDKGEKTSYGKMLIDNNVYGFQNKSLTLITIFILVDMKNPNSFYKDYYEILPKNINNFPLLWGTKVLNLLKGTILLNKIYDRKKYLINDYKIICNNCPGFENEFSFERFIKIRLLVGSRNFGIFIDGIKKSAMVPLADSFNHSFEPTLNWGYNDGFFEMRSPNIIKPGIEIYDSYGKKCNSILLLTYGFLLDNNENNTLSFTLYDNNVELEFNLNADINSLMCSGLDEYLNKYCKDVSNIKADKKRLLRNIMTSLLTRYTSQHIIKKKLKESKQFSPENIACRFVMGELKIIKFFINYSKS